MVDYRPGVRTPVSHHIRSTRYLIIDPRERELRLRHQCFANWRGVGTSRPMGLHEAGVPTVVLAHRGSLRILGFSTSVVWQGA